MGDKIRRGPDSTPAVRRALHSDETVVWTGRGSLNRLELHAVRIAAVVPAVVAYPFLLIARLYSNTRHGIGVSNMMKAFGITMPEFWTGLGVVSVLWLIGLLFWIRQRASRTEYAITDARVLIVGADDVDQISKGSISRIEIDRGFNGKGNLTFVRRPLPTYPNLNSFVNALEQGDFIRDPSASRTPYGVYGDETRQITPSLVLYGINDVERVANLARTALGLEPHKPAGA